VKERTVALSLPFAERSREKACRSRAILLHVQDTARGLHENGKRRTVLGDFAVVS
jgi:hypothetical protein